MYPPGFVQNTYGYFFLPIELKRALFFFGIISRKNCKLIFLPSLSIIMQLYVQQ